MIWFLFLLKIFKLSWSKFKEKFFESGLVKVYVYYCIKKNYKKIKIVNGEFYGVVWF